MKFNLLHRLNQNGAYASRRVRREKAITEDHLAGAKYAAMRQSSTCMAGAMRPPPRMAIASSRDDVSNYSSLRCRYSSTCPLLLSRSQMARWRAMRATSTFL